LDLVFLFLFFFLSVVVDIHRRILFFFLGGAPPPGSGEQRGVGSDVRPQRRPRRGKREHCHCRL
jgi:hypothetical protein